MRTGVFDGVGWDVAPYRIANEPLPHNHLHSDLINFTVCHCDKVSLRNKGVPTSLINV